MAVLPSPHIAACEELISMIEAPRAIYAQNIESESQLRELWEIDKAAYADCSLDFEPFLAWWKRYEYGSRNLILAGKIVASIGIYPLYAEQAEAFSLGKIRESELQPVLLHECEQSRVSHWYCSGIVVVPEFQNRGLLRTLLQIGIGAWAATSHIQYPLSLYGLAEYKIGEKLFKKFGFQKVQDKSEMLDNCDLYKTEIFSIEQLEEQLHERGF
jgi:GNAT superfamily N-acetyltransferase